jgi:acyl-homoserine lactone acylase PvdQ
MFGGGPSRRFYAVLDPAGIQAGNILPGGTSGAFFHPNYTNQMGRWLTNQYHDLSLGEADGVDNAIIMHNFKPPGHAPSVYYQDPD